jgi:hypothetical protein
MSNPELIDAESIANLRARVGLAHAAVDKSSDVEIDMLREALETALAMLESLGIDVTPEPWCNHDAVAVVDGVCECGMRVS